MDTSTPAGIWYLLGNGWRNELSLQFAHGVTTGTFKNEGGPPERVDNITWDPASRWLEFRRCGPNYFQWYRMSLTYGVMAGRFSHSSAAAKPDLTAYAYHSTGWSPNWLDTDIVPRTWNLTLNTVYKGVLRIDRDSAGVLRGRLKVYAPGEELEDDLVSISWDGTHLSFTRSAGFTQVYTGTANGRLISGTFTHNGGAPIPWSGSRAEVLGFGLGSRLRRRDEWQAAARAQIINLTEGMRLINVGIPPIGVTRRVRVNRFGGGYPPERDDDPNACPATYRLEQMTFSVSPGSRFDPRNPPPPRVYNGYLATPTTRMPAGGFPAVVAVNGHGGSAQQCMTPSSDLYWYGDSAARRGFIVLAIDIGHRPHWNAGPVVHPPIVDANYPDSNWEEDGERVFSVRRAIDWLLAQTNVRRDRLFIWGLSMGGEITTITGALDPRIAMSIPCGFSPDMHVMDSHGNHPCYRWYNADIHEYLDVSDWAALTAPRGMLIETGKVDGTYSSANPPWAADKQVVRRGREAYGPSGERLVHYLHYDEHKVHVGALNPTNPGRPTMVLQPVYGRPRNPSHRTWQTDDRTTVRSPSVYHLMNELVP